MTRPKGVTEKFPRDYSRPPLHPDQPLDSIGRVRNMGRPKGARNMINRTSNIVHSYLDTIKVGNQYYVITNLGNLIATEIVKHSVGDVITLLSTSYTIVRGEDGELKLQ